MHPFCSRPRLSQARAAAVVGLADAIAARKEEKGFRHREPKRKLGIRNLSDGAPSRTSKQYELTSKRCASVQGARKYGWKIRIVLGRPLIYAPKLTVLQMQLLVNR